MQNKEVRIMEDMLKLILTKLDNLENNYKSLEDGQKQLQKDVSIIKRDLKGVWDDIKRIDRRITVHDEAIEALQRKLL